jgi:hypothetical protein
MRHGQVRRGAAQVRVKVSHGARSLETGLSEAIN